MDGHDARQGGEAADEAPELVIMAGDPDVDRQLRIEVLDCSPSGWNSSNSSPAPARSGRHPPAGRPPRSCRGAGAAWRRRTPSSPRAAGGRHRGWPPCAAWSRRSCAVRVPWPLPPPDGPVGRWCPDSTGHRRRRSTDRITIALTGTGHSPMLFRSSSLSSLRFMLAYPACSGFAGVTAAGFRWLAVGLALASAAPSVDWVLTLVETTCGNRLRPVPVLSLFSMSSRLRVADPGGRLDVAHEGRDPGVGLGAALQTRLRPVCSSLVRKTPPGSS